MNSENLKTFVLLSKLKNFTQTAEQLFIAQSTVTNRIAELEREVGKKLFLRDSKNLSLTEEGAIFLDYVLRILELEDACLKEVRVTRTDKLRIGLPNAIYETFWEERIKRCLREGGISFQVVLGHATDMLQKLQDKLLDVVYTFQAFSITGDQLLSVRFLMCNFALQELGSFVRELFPVHTTFDLEIDNSTKLIPYLLDGLGYSFLPRRLMKPYLEEGRLVEVKPLDFENPKIEVYRVYRAGSPVKELLEKFGL